MVLAMARTPKTTTVRDLRSGNQSRALWDVYLNGPLTRQEIADHSGLSLASVSNLVGALLRQRVVEEVGLEDSNGGRPRGLLQVNPGHGYGIGVDLGACIVSNRELYRGATSSAGEWGHTTASINGRPCRCGARGCLEAYIGAAAIAARYDELRGRRRRIRSVELEHCIADILAAGS